MSGEYALPSATHLAADRSRSNTLNLAVKSINVRRSEKASRKEDVFLTQSLWAPVERHSARQGFDQTDMTRTP